MYRVICVLFVNILLLTLNITYSANAVSERLINPTGGTNSSDGIRLYIGSNSQIQVVSYSNLTGAPGVYPQMFSGCTTPSCNTYGIPTSGSLFNSIVLRLEPIGGGSARAIYTNSDSPLSGSLTFTQTSQSSITGTGTNLNPYVVTTVLNPPAPDNGITVTIIDSYIFPNNYFSRSIDITGLPATEQAKLYWYLDTFLAGGDAGIPTSQTNINNTTGRPDFVGVTKPGVIQGIQSAAGMPLWDHYFSGYWFTPANDIMSVTGDLSDVIETAFIDNGIAVQWNIPAGDTSFSVQTGQTYAGSAVVSESFNPSTINAGEITSLQFAFQNFDTGDAVNNITLSTYTLPLGVSFATNLALVNNCTGSTVTISGTTIQFENINLDVAINAITPYVCTISLNVTANAAGSYTSTIIATDPRLFAGGSGLDVLVVSRAITGDVESIPVNSYFILFLLVSGLGLIRLVMVKHRRHF